MVSSDDDELFLEHDLPSSNYANEDLPPHQSDVDLDPFMNSDTKQAPGRSSLRALAQVFFG